MSSNLIVILGPTACGKTSLATQLAYALKTEIISADSRQVYRKLNIGTGKDLDNYTVNNTPIPYHLIDIVDIENQYNIHQFKIDCNKIKEMLAPKIPILCGGSGLYIDSILSNYDFSAIPVNENLRRKLSTLNEQELINYFKRLPKTEFSEIADLSTAKRLTRAIEICTYLQTNTIEKQINETKPIIIGLDPPREIRRDNIEKRLIYRLKNGLLEEVEQLLKDGIHPDRLIFLGLEYKFITEFFQKKYTFEVMQSLLCIAIQQYAKRQMTYFRKMEKDGKQIHWFDNGNDNFTTILQLIRSYI